MTDIHIPRMIRHRMEDLLRETGIPAELDTPVQGRYILTHRTERVLLTCIYARNSRGDLAYHSTLQVDGERRPLVENVWGYRRLISNPDNLHPQRRPAPPLPVVLPLPSDHELPVLIAKVLDKAQVKTENVVTVGVPDDAEDDTHEYVIEVIRPDSAAIHLYFAPTPQGGGHVLCGVAAVDTFGGNVMDDYKNDPVVMLRELIGLHLPPSAGSPTPRGPARPDSSGAVSNSVTVRKSTVFRI